ncbi:MAG TPA: pitrilysin family protein [Candidatus Aminicenantes bacterium]|nr:pitrilysin family protein [Candidatus Aminicenantes bacterium]HRY65216.1 pitrilysin family protein [Candidatus Aminicenantes bacterium]HRZ72316.1 pitrilysin family protein [Candidatus Aminicenantes bacterium]
MIEMNRKARILVLAALIALPRPAAADAQAADAVTSFPFAFQDYRLRNGLRVVLAEDARLPLVTVAVGYAAGSLREKQGQEGLAYLLENLMFQGSENVPPLQHITFVQKVGGELNAVTTPDKALFYETLPSNQLPLALWLESDRMKSLVITPAAIERTRQDIIDENRARSAADLYYATFAQLDMLLFPDPVYGHPLVGEGLAALTETDVQEFHRTFYVPNNAVLCIVGNIEAARTRELVARYFETIPPGPEIPPLPLASFRRENDAVVRFARIPDGNSGFHMGFRFAPLQPGDSECLRLLEYVLLEGETSRLRNRLLRRDLTARYLTGGLDERPGVAALKLFAFCTNAILVARAEKAILAEIDRLKTNAASAEELAKARRRFKKDYYDRLSTSMGKARFLVDAVIAGRDQEAIRRDLDRVLSVSPQNLSSFAAKYFVPQNRVVLEFGPK